MAQKTNMTQRITAMASGPGPEPAAPPRRRFRRRPPPASDALRLFYFFGTCLVVFALCQAGIGALVHMHYLRLNHLKVDGVSKPVSHELQAVADKAMGGNRNILTLDVGDLAHRMAAAHPGIRDLRLEKMYPDTLLIHAHEREPAAMISADGFYLADHEGHVIKKLTAEDIGDYDFPCISGIKPEEIKIGEKIPKPSLYKALDLTRILKDRNPELYERVSEVNIGSGVNADDLTALLNGGMEVRFGDRDPISKLPALELFISMMKEQKIDPFAMAYVDLRFNDQIVYMDKNIAMAEAAGMLDKIQQMQKDELEKLEKTSNTKDPKTKSGKSASKAQDDSDSGRKKSGRRSSRADDGADNAGDTSLNHP